MDVMNHIDVLAPTENQPEASEALIVDSTLNDFLCKLDINKGTMRYYIIAMLRT